MSHFDFVDELPYGICQRCNGNSGLYILAPVFPGSDLGGFICKNCVTELAIFAGFVKGEEHKEILAKLYLIISEQEAQLETIPNLMEGLIENVNHIISDFVTDLASVPSPTKLIQFEDLEANTGEPAKKLGRPRKDATEQ